MIKRNLYKYTAICLIIGMAFADDNTAPLHYQAECVACHEQMVSGNAKVLYTRKDRLVKNYVQLKQRIHYCKEQLGLDWSDEQTRLVADYLAKQYYKYPLLPND